MRRSAAIAAGLVFALQASTLHAQTRSDTILSLVRIEDTYFASTRLGLFHSNRTDHIWSPITLPVGVNFGGCLYPAPGNSRMFYSPPVQPLDPRETNCLPGRGLWVSSNAGATWTQLDDTHFFIGLLAHPNNRLYAAASDSADPRQAIFGLQVGMGKPVTSGDGGKTWEPITGKNAPLQVLGFYPCKKESTHICAAASGSMPSPAEYAPERDEWIRQNPFEELTSVDPTFMSVIFGSGTSPCCYMLRATLANFYQDFPDGSLQKTAIVIRAAKPEYRFRLKGAQMVDVVVEILPYDPPLALRIPDIKTSQAFWGVKYIDAGGHGHVAWPQAGEQSSLNCIPPNLDNRVCSASNAASTIGATSDLIKVGKPFERKLDMSAMGTFDKPGVYRVALIFDNSKLPKSDPTDWTGFISGPTFQITVLP